MFNINQKKASNNGFIQKVKNFFFGGSKDKAKYVPVNNPEKAHAHTHTWFSLNKAKQGHKEKKKRINRRRADIAFESRRYNYIHA